MTRSCWLLLGMGPMDGNEQEWVIDTKKKQVETGSFPIGTCSLQHSTWIEFGEWITNHLLCISLSLHALTGSLHARTRLVRENLILKKNATRTARAQIRTVRGLSVDWRTRGEILPSTVKGLKNCVVGLSARIHRKIYWNVKSNKGISKLQQEVNDSYMYNAHANNSKCRNFKVPTVPMF